MQQPILETPRLRLRPFAGDLSDLDAMQAVLGDPVSMRFYPHPFSREEARRWIERNVECYRSDGFGLLAIEDRASGDVIGDCGPTIQQVDGEALVELGWHVLRARQGEGIATEAARACRDHLLATTEISPLIALVRPENAPSRRVAEKLGMSVWRETLHAGCGHLVYALHRAA